MTIRLPRHPCIRPLTASLVALLLTACGRDELLTDTGGSSTSTGDTSDETTATPTTQTPTTVTPTTDGPTTTVEPTTVEPTTVEPTTVEPTTVEPETDSGPVSDSEADTDTSSTSTTGDTDTTDTTGTSSTGGSFCGDGVVDEGELCDDGINDGSYNGCMADCQAVGPFCGDAEINGPEVCDDANDDNTDGCTTACAPPSCGDGLVLESEECDGENLNGSDCVALGFKDGILQCTDTCNFDSSACTGCGDGVKADDETCDGDDLGGEDCGSQGFPGGGTLACAPACDAFDTSLCIADLCGNDIIDDPEVCDGTDLGGADCASVDPNVFGGGTLACNADCGGLDSSQCTSGGCCDINEEDSSICNVQAIADCTCDFDVFCCFIWDETCMLEAIDFCGSVCL